MPIDRVYVHPARIGLSEQAETMGEVMAEGIWTMSESEFTEEIRKAQEVAWEEGLIDGVSHFGQMAAPPNPYAVKQ